MVTVFLDMEMAFDQVLHNDFLHKFYQMNTPINLSKLIDSFSIVRTFCVWQVNHISNSRTITVGLLQRYISAK